MHRKISSPALEHYKNKLRFGGLEHYDAHIPFERQAAMTSSIRPVYLFSGLFADYIFTPYRPSGFDASGERPQMRLWGDGDMRKWPWSTQSDIAAWTIDILLHGEGVQVGNGGFFRFRSGEHTLNELAAAYEKAFESRVDVTREVSLEDLEDEVARQRKEKGRARHWEYHALAVSLLGTKGLFEMTNVTVPDYVKKPTTLEEHVQKSK